MLGCEASPDASGETSNVFDPTGTSSSTGTTEGTTFDDASACAASSECEAGYCVAPYDAGAGTGTAGMGPASCVPECVPVDALDRWCIDDASCCEGSTCDARDGFCVGPPVGTDESTIGESWSTGSSGESSSGAGESSSSDTGATESSSGG